MKRMPKAPASESAHNEGDANQYPTSGMGMMANGFAAQQPQQPVLPPPPNPGPSIGPVIGAVLAGMAATIITVAVLGHRHLGHTMLDAGSQIDLVLQSPLMLDAAQVAAAVNTPNAQ